MKRDRDSILTWANLLTAIRLVIIPICGLAIFEAAWGQALVLFTLAVITDLLDGAAARHFKQASPLGGVFDHATDALLVTCTLGACALTQLVPWPLVALIPAAFLQYTFDSRVLTGQNLRTSYLGRINGIAYYVLAGAVIVREALDFTWLPLLLVSAFGWLLVVSTAMSMLDRWLAWRRLR
ncbi:MAG: CDP-alcohol phosphatidyltransferase family protein [Pseudomonadales bacterium]|nr:CDP-alcohol phosphatidyltransferase family protein [Pseudomonadales bacterium]MDP6469908.1 CDP-alcohol phosphatidyltransferase family protein [Pseudomonadales bacterium]MDP6827489.1 CDP-alcohol phosphatidyltransferase family protein [Pseudomonadales bacterium]MDP6970771.1 CDP-alcohol phosphatidyltransferase family protein [Pseudomonadales bacterium]